MAASAFVLDAGKRLRSMTASAGSAASGWGFLYGVVTPRLGQITQ